MMWSVTYKIQYSTVIIANCSIAIVTYGVLNNCYRNSVVIFLKGEEKLDLYR